MTAVERILLERIKRRSAAMQPALQRRILTAFDLIRMTLSPAELERASENGSLDRLLDKLLSDKELDRSLSPLRAMIDRETQNAGDSWRLLIPQSVQPNVFNILNPRVIDAIRALDTKVIQGIKLDVRESVRQASRAGLEAGVGPRKTARVIRDSLGLAPNQEAAVRNFRRMLETGDREALTRELRDKRFDPTLNRLLGKGGKGLSVEQVERMSEAYRKRMIAFNAETHARTIALDAQALAQRMSWQDAIDQGSVDADRLVREWIAVGGPHGDGRNRPQHLAMHGERVRWGQRWSNGEDIPGDQSWNCRCQERITLLPAVKMARAA